MGFRAVDPDAVAVHLAVRQNLIHHHHIRFRAILTAS
jgi:hypothetical protein